MDQKLLELEARVLVAEMEAQLAVDQFFNHGKRPVNNDKQMTTTFGHIWDERTRRCSICDVSQRDFHLRWPTVWCRR